LKNTDLRDGRYRLHELRGGHRFRDGLLEPRRQNPPPILIGCERRERDGRRPPQLRIRKPSDVVE
jgi:hypothetical protein